MVNRTVKIVFNAMVKNESKIILRMLESVYKYIDYWVIQDNGSTDGTQKIIEDFFRDKNIPGFLYFEPWQFPGYNRNHTLQKCLETNHGCEYILRLDADEVLEVDDDFDWEELRCGDEVYVYSIQRGVTVSRPWIWNASLDWEYTQSRRHELLVRKSRQGWRQYYLSNKLRQHMLPGGVTWENPFKYYIDSIELEQQVIKYEKKDPSHVDYKMDSYYVWYLAISYVDFLEDCKVNKAKPFFGKEHESEMARRSIFYFKKYLEMSLPVNYNDNLTTLYTVENLDTLGAINEMAYMAIVFIAKMYMNYIDPNEALKFLKKSCEFDPRRNEGLMSMAYYYHNTNNYAMVYQCTSLAMKNSFYKKIRDFFMESTLYPDSGYEVLDLHSFSAYKLGFYEEAQLTCKKMIDNIQLVPEHERERIITNYQFFTKH